MNNYRQRSGICLLVLCLFMVSALATAHAIEHSVEHVHYSWQPSAYNTDVADADDGLCGLCLLATSLAISQDLPPFGSAFAASLGKKSELVSACQLAVRLRPQGRAPPSPC